MDQKKSCVVCGDSCDGIHFHVESCQACAAFFRRTIALNKVYRCLHQDNCAINMSIRCMCRACRFKKCVNVGMNKEAVHPSRGATGKHKFHKTRRRQGVQLENDGHTQDVRVPSMQAQAQPISDYQIGSPLAQSIQLHSLPYLSGMQIAYRNLLERRRATHECQAIQGLFDSNQTEVPAANIDGHIDGQQKEFGLVSEMLNEFGHFRELPVDQKCAIFKRFYVQFFVAERSYDTLKTFGANTAKFLLPNRSYIDGNNLEQFYRDGTIAKKDPRESARIFRTLLDPIINNIIKRMGEINITEIELLALIGQLVWSAGTPNLTTETRALAKNIRETIFHEMQAYYSDIQAENSFLRFGSLMLLIPAIHAINVIMRENIQMFKIFDLVKADGVFDQLLSS